jgi:hypothetical protein
MDERSKRASVLPTQTSRDRNESVLRPVATRSVPVLIASAKFEFNNSKNCFKS